MKDVVPRELANRDGEEAIEHYLLETTAKLALGFIDKLEKVYHHIARHPSSGSPRYAHQLGSQIRDSGASGATLAWSSTKSAKSTWTPVGCCTNSQTSRRG